MNSPDFPPAKAVGKLEMYVQPQYCLLKQSFTDIELLARFRRSTGQILSPNKFMPLLRQSKTRQEFACWTINQAITVAKDLKGRGFKGKVAVNMDGEDLNQPTIDHLKAKMADGESVTNLEIELTEEVRSCSNTITAEALMQIKSLGVTVSIDDFGTGSNGLQALLNFPFDKLKADRSLMMAGDLKREAVVRGLVSMTQQLDKALVIEGVEHQADAMMLKKWGVRNVQGYLYGRPMPMGEFIRTMTGQGEVNAN